MVSELMTEEEALLALHAMEDLLDHPGWKAAAERWRKIEREYDQALHRERVDDTVRMQICQTSCRLLREVLATPGQMMAEYREVVS